MTTLNGVRLPAQYNGIGFHDTPGCYAATFPYNDSLSHAQNLRAHGVTLYKLFVSGGNKVERARAYEDSGILPIVRDWVDHPWGRPPGSWVMPADQIRMYADVGVQLFEIAGNEFNIACEWVNDNIPNDPAAIARATVDAFEVALNACAQVSGTYPLLSSATPGGNVGHRACYKAIVNELNARGLMGSVKHLAVHPRPHNNPPDAKWSATNTVTFDEWRWIRNQFGAGRYFWATEHGYSVGDNQNHDYPPIDLTRHTEYNWELDLRMRRSHPKATEPELAGTSHWFEAGWGHLGAWAKDSLRDSNVPEMPAPSPLLIRMGQRAGDLAFIRYTDAPPVNKARGFDCSFYQGDINWNAVADDFAFVFIRASRATPQFTLEADPKFTRNYQAAGAKNLLRGAYHTLRANPWGQAAFFYKTVANRELELGYYGSMALAELSAYKCQMFLEAMDGWIQQTDGTGVYTRATIFDKFGAPPWAVNRNLWVAHYGVAEPTLPDAWNKYEFWQTGQASVAGQQMYVDVYCGDEAALEEEYGS